MKTPDWWGNSVEVRTNEGTWRTLDDSEINLHFRLGTEVAHWLRTRWIEANPHGSEESFVVSRII
jgi:hypothetical protein